MSAMRRVEEVMGMPVTVQVGDDAAESRALDALFEDFALLDRTFSPFLVDSEVSRINRGDLRLEDAGQLVNQAIHLCHLYEQATRGFFSAWIAGRFDPSGLVKGWAIDRACSILEGYGYGNYFVDAGGDVQTRGRNAEGGPWRVGIRHPVERDKVTEVVLASGLAVATSGTYEKGGHIVDPHNGEPAGAWLSFTVVGPDILEADVYATACFAMGVTGLEFMSQVARYEAYAIDHTLRGSHTAGFKALCENPSASGSQSRSRTAEAW
jgi:FAD:protein FMN transferase